jgi:hypothetical protein
MKKKQISSMFKRSNLFQIVPRPDKVVHGRRSRRVERRLQLVRVRRLLHAQAVQRLRLSPGLLSGMIPCHYVLLIT